VALPYLPATHCRICATPLESGVVCGPCLRRLPHFDTVTAAFIYSYPVDALIHALKYGGQLAVARLLAEALSRADAPPPDLLIPMPLAPQRLRERGFNQAQEIARLVGARLNVEIASDICRKVVETPPQATLPWKERAHNVRGAFVCDVDLEGLRVAVVDDVITTGSTLNEVARLLRKAGATEIVGWVVARTLPHAPILRSIVGDGARG
jgi:ComF family protein